MKEDDVLIIKRVLGGSKNDFALLVDRYKNLIFSLALKFFNNGAAAEDAAHETFVKAYKKLASFRLEYDFKNWICAICVNTCRDFRRRGRRKETVGSGLADDAGSVPAAVPEAERARLRECIARLPFKYRKVIILRYFDEKSYEEIAAIAAIPVGTVKTFLFRGQKLLYEMFVSDSAR